MATDTPARVRYLPRNESGRDYCVGDIHGMFDLLVRLLDKAGFDPAHDRLISVGDLVDRGPESMRAVEFLNRPWFHAIRGNHEDMLIRCVEVPSDQSNKLMWANNGGQWWLDTRKEERERIYAAVQPLPLALQIDTEDGPVGVVHADIPPGLDWPTFMEQLEHDDQHAQQTALWSRMRAKMYKVAGPVPGIERVYCGHNIVDTPRQAGNVHFIDTGAFIAGSGQLTMVDIAQRDPQPISLEST